MSAAKENAMVKLLDRPLFKPEPLRIRCPNGYCKAPQGTWCMTPRGKFAGVHGARWDAWEKAEEFRKIMEAWE